jgi:uncharacterized RDD family membrane protein YckC
MSKKYLLNSGLRTAKLSRVLAKAIDIFIVVILSMLFYPLGVILGVLYMSIADSFQRGQSAGKKFIGFGVLSLEDGKPCKTKQSIIRNLPFTIPILFLIIPIWGWILSIILFVPFMLLELYFIFNLDSGHRLGDVMADTTVIANDQNQQLAAQKKNSWFDAEDAQTTLKTPQ